MKFGRLEIMMAAPIPMLALAGCLLVLCPAYNSGVFDPPGLLPVLNMTFLFLFPLVVCFLSLRSYLVTGTASLIMLGGGALAFAVGSFVAGFLLSRGPNAVVTIHNGSVLLAGVLHMTGAFFALQGVLPEETVWRRKLHVAVMTGAILVTVGVATFCLLRGWLPVFFIQGQGPTLLRQYVLGAAALSFLLASLMLLKHKARQEGRFLAIYAMALLLVFIGLTCIFYQKSFGSPLGWTGRISQYLAGVYFIVAVLDCMKESHIKGIGLDRLMAKCLTGPLEQLVEERTARLAESNRNLSVEADRRKVAETALQDANWRLQSIIEATNVGTWEWNVQTGETVFSERWAEIVGHSLAELQPVSIKTWESLVHPDDLGQSASLLERHFSGELPNYECECRMKHKNGTWVWVLDRGRLITRTADGKPLMMFGTHTDITLRKQMESGLIERERLSAVGEIASGVAHDFNNALQAMMGNIELALLENDTPATVRGHITTVRTAAADAAARVKQLQRFAGKGRSECEFLPVNLNTVLEEAVEQAKPLWKAEAERKGLSIRIVTAYGPVKGVTGSSSELRSAFYNVIRNSVEAMPSGGTITIETGSVGTGSYARVSDTGTGMSEETRKRLFQPFYTTKGLELGRGLGMSTAYTAVKSHNGSIRVLDTAEGRGTTIEVLLPEGAMSVSSAVPDAVQSAPAAASARILWVDDEVNLRVPLRILLGKMGFQADFAESGAKALSLMENTRYDLVLTDIGMPGMNGWQLADRILEKYAGTKVVIVTGWDADVSAGEMERHGVCGVVGKPVTSDKIKSLIDDVLRKQL